MIHFPGFSEELVYSVMEMLRGRLLSEHMGAIRAGEEPAHTMYEAAELCDSLLQAIEKIHESGVLHLDLKPSLIWEMQQPTDVALKVLDFGLAHVADPELLGEEAR